MGGWRWIRRRLEVLFRKDDVEAELDDEIRYHLEREIEEHVRAGVDPAEARRRALVAFGGVERHKEQVRDVRGARVLDDLVQDARVAVRAFAKQPAFTLAVLVTLGLGIGGNVAMFGILEASLFRTLPYPEPQRLVMGRVTWNGETGNTVSGPDYFDVRDQSSSFSELGAYTPFSIRATLTGTGEPDRVGAVWASGSFFRALGVEPALGRTFTPEEGERGAPPVAVISHGLWERRFGSDPGILGRSADFNGNPVTVVGVMPAGFRFTQDADVWFAMQRDGAWAQARQFHNWVMVGRLAPGVGLDRAQDEVDRITAGLAEAYPETNRNKGMSFTPLRAALNERYENTLAILAASVAALLLIACGNVAGLLLARGSARSGELAVRSVMGAGRGRLSRQLITETAILAAGAGVVGVVLAVWMQRGILAFVSMDRLGPVEPSLSPATLGFALGLSAVTVVLFGVVPSLRMAATDPAGRLRSGNRTAGERGTTRFRNGLVVAQVALTAVLLVTSGLLVRSFDALRKVETGFDPTDLLAASVQISSTRYPDAEARIAFFRQLSQAVAAVPGVEGVGLASHIPVRDPGGDVRVDLPERFGTSGVFGQLAFRRTVAPGYFDAMGIPLLAGRDVAFSDTRDAPPAVVVSEDLAERLYPGEDPLGRTVGMDAGGDEPEVLEIVGVVGDVVVNHPADGQPPAFYLPYGQRAGTAMSMVVRGRGDLTAVTTSVRDILRSMDPDIPLADVGTMDTQLARAVSGTGAVTLVLGLFAATALLLAAVGLYGVLAYQVSRRLHEIGIRMALGAATGNVLGSVVRGDMALVIVGVALGVPASYYAARLAQGLLFGVGVADPGTYAVVGIFLLAVGAVACVLPALRAARVDPVVAFRSE